MSVMETLAFSRGSFTIADLAGMPDDGRKYELIDGQLIVTAGVPLPRHQIVLSNLLFLLQPACPADLRLIVPGLGVEKGIDTHLEPDLSVVRREDYRLDGRGLTGTPLLVVEVASPATERYDRTLKRDVYAEMEIPSYWIVDPVEPSIKVLTLSGRDYVLESVTGAGLTIALEQPFAVEIEVDRLHA